MLQLNDLRQKRKDLDLSQVELAKAVGCHKQQIWNFESGAAPIPIEYAPAYAKALKVSEAAMIEFILEAAELKLLKRLEAFKRKKKKK